MRIGNYELKRYRPPLQFQQDAPTKKDYNKEISSANSPYYEKSQLRPYNPDDLYQKKGNAYDIFDDIREDDQVYAALTLKKLIVLNADYEIESEDEDVKEFIEACLDEYLEDIFSKSLYEILTAFDYGVSFTEKVFDIQDTDFGTKIILKKLKTRAPHGWEIYTDDFGNLDYLIQRTGFNDEPLDPGKFILYSYNKEFDNYYGKSDINKAVYRAWWSKDAIIKFWNIYLERFGMPVHVGKIPRGNPADKDRFMDVLKNIQSKTAITMPNDFEIDLLQVSKGAGEYEAAIDKYNTMIARKFLIPDLMGLSGGETGGGSYALGKEQFEMFYTTVQYVRSDLARLVNREIIQPLVFWNYGSNKEANFMWSSIDEAKKKQDLEMWLSGVNTGKIPITDTHVNWFLGQVNAPEISEQELKDIQDKKDEMAAAIQGGDSDSEDKEDTTEKKAKKEEGKEPGGEEKGGGDKEKEPEKKFEQKERVLKQEFEQAFHRELTQYEKRYNFVAIEKSMDDIEKEYMDELGAAYTLMINALVNDIKKKNIVKNKRLDLINKLTLKHTAKVQRTYAKIAKDSYVEGKEGANVPTEFGVIDPGPELSDEEFKAYTKEWLEYITNIENEEILKSVRGSLFDGIKDGKPVNEIIKQVNTALEGYNVAVAPVRLEMLVRTTITKFYNDGRLEEFNKVSEHIQGYQFVAILDGRTSDVCTRLDKRFFRKEEAGTYTPPLHFRCRSTMVPVYTIEEFEGFTTDNSASSVNTETDKFGMLRLVK